MFGKMWTFGNKTAGTEKNRYKEKDNAFYWTLKTEQKILEDTFLQ